MIMNQYIGVYIKITPKTKEVSQSNYYCNHCDGIKKFDGPINFCPNCGNHILIVTGMDIRYLTFFEITIEINDIDHNVFCKAYSDSKDSIMYIYPNTFRDGLSQVDIEVDKNDNIPYEMTQFTGPDIMAKSIDAFTKKYAQELEILKSKCEKMELCFGVLYYSDQ